nr:chloride channel protein 2-like [Leptinotarsa decemlineata]
MATEEYFGEENLDEMDREWEDFAKLREQKRSSSQGFYPCPPPEDVEDYIQTLMYGRYSKQLGEFAKLEGLKAAEKQRVKAEKARKRDLRGYQGKFAKTISLLWKHTFARLGEDWVFLALLGIIMALLSFVMDRGISVCDSGETRPITEPIFTSFKAFSIFQTTVDRSGIPEMKTILRGVALKEYLTFRTLIAKVVGLTATLGSGMPLGKEGPFVHIASIAATLLSKLVTGFQGIYENESRTTEMLAAACAVGVASCFAAPVGGVLFSIEVTTTYFAVRNYWRGFFAAVCGATTFRLLAVWFQRAETVRAVFKTSFFMEFPFDPQELFVFALMGAVCGLGGAFYVWVHRKYVMYMRNNKLINSFFKKNSNVPEIQANIQNNSQISRASLFLNAVTLYSQLPEDIHVRMYNVHVENFMVRDVKYIFYTMSYNQLKTLLKENRRLQSFPLVDSPESMVLLGSIQRLQLIQLIEKHIGKERRLQVAAIRQREAEEKAIEEALKKAEERTKRRPSRFQVVPAPDMLQRQSSENNLDQPTYNPVFGSQPKKSILKKTNSFTLKGFTPFVTTSPGSTPYTTVTGAESRIRSAFEAIFRKSAQLQDVEGNAESQESNGQIVAMSPIALKKVQLPSERVCDMSPEDQIKWEEEQMQLPVDFSACHIDPAPFQLVERTSLLKVHSLFSMVGVNHAYVTAIGKLVGVVGLKDLRKAIEDANSGNLHSTSTDTTALSNGKISASDIKDSLENVHEIVKDSKM